MVQHHTFYYQKFYLTATKTNAMQLNFFLTLLIASAVPLFVGFVWYHPRVFGNAWMKSASLNEESLKQGPNMFLIFGLTYLLGFFISFLLSGIVIHQMGFYSMLQNHFKEPETMQLFTDVMAKYGNDFRTFNHGALHGGITGVALALPVLAVNALFERKGFSYIAINAGFWIVSMIIMGGIICQWANLATI